LASTRSSIGLELDPTLGEAIQATLCAAHEIGSRRIAERLEAHRSFVAERENAGRPLKHKNIVYGFPVVTSQEVDLELLWPGKAHGVGPQVYEANHSSECPKELAFRQAELEFLK
jgi:hypothetical protein